MHLLENAIQPYAWGSRTAIAELQQRPTPSDGPEAELWMGAHPGAPSKLVRGTERLSLLDWVRQLPEQTLGAETVRAFGAQLPFLFKVLAAGTPLSLQAHPSLEQAKDGFAREDTSGVPLTASHRNYKDANHKPELICALTPFDALCGFRSIDETLQLFEALGVSELEPVLAPLMASPDPAGLRDAFERLMTLPAQTRRSAVDATVQACRDSDSSKVPRQAFAASLRWAVKLGELYPGDPGVIGSLLLNLVTLEPGEAIYLPAGNLHAYLQGVGVELMANSDNVLRGGCTPKHVDVPELLRVLDFRVGPVPVVRPSSNGAERVYETPAREFRLSEIRLEGACPDCAISTRRGPDILLCTKGRAVISAGDQSLELQQGASAFITAGEGPYLVRGAGTVFRATVP